MKDPAALIYIDKWLVSTKGMKASARGWYLNLILHQYDKGSLPNNIEDLADFADVKHSEFEEFKQVFEQVLKQKFVENSEGRLINEFAQEIIKKRESFKEKRSDSGKWSYILKYIRKNHINNKDFELFLKDNIDLNFDTKNEHLIEQVFKQNYELFINVNKDIDLDISFNNNAEISKNTNNNIDPDLQKRIETFEKICQKFLEEDLQNFVDYFKTVDIREKNIKEALKDYKDDKIIGDVKSIPFKYSYFKEWFKKYITDNRAKYVHIPKFRVTYIDEKVERLDLHAAFDFYWQPEYTIEFIRDKIYSGEFKPKNNLNFKKLIDDKLITTEND